MNPRIARPVHGSPPVQAAWGGGMLAGHGSPVIQSEHVLWTKIQWRVRSKMLDTGNHAKLHGDAVIEDLAYTNPNGRPQSLAASLIL